MKKWPVFLFLLFRLYSTLAQPVVPLPIDQAFILSSATDHNAIILNWVIAPGYYLYKDHFLIHAVHSNQLELGPLLLPQNKVEKTIPGIGQFPVYLHHVQIVQPIVQSTTQNFQLQIHYQGCSEYGFCYPPISKTISIHLPQVPTASLATTSPPISTVLSYGNIVDIMIAFTLLGMVISLTPCVLPMIPILSSIIIGQGKIRTKRACALSFSYVFGIASAYAIAGIVFSVIGVSVQTAFQKPWLIILFALIFIAMAGSLFDLYTLQLPQPWRSKLSHHNQRLKPSSLFGTALLGAMSILIVSPCATPPLIGALAYMSQSGHIAIGAIALFMMGMGQGIPLLLIGLLGPNILPRTGTWMVTIKRLMGMLMLAVALWTLSSLLNKTLVLWLWALLILSTSIVCNTFKTTDSWPQHILKALGILLFIYGVCLSSNTLQHKTNPFNIFTLSSATAPLPFIIITNSAELESQFDATNHQNKPVLLDFYADWCTSCKELDALLFSKPAVQAALKNMVLLRADVTKNDVTSRALEARFHVIAPPALLFFDQHHHEIKNARIIGVVSENNFLKQLSLVTGAKD